MNDYAELSCYYRLRQNPKKTQKSSLDNRLGLRTRNKKRLILCEECSKGFRYEKCLLKHRELMHSLNQKKEKSDSEESMIMDLLCSFSDEQRRKRSKRVSRYKKIPRFSVSSSSFGNFPVSEDDGELLEVAKSLILLSKSDKAPVLKSEMNLRELEDWFLSNEQNFVGKLTDGSLSNEQKFVGISSESDGKSKDLLGYLGGKTTTKDDESDQLKQVGDRPGVMLQNAETDMELKLGGQETAFEESEHRCRLCDKAFSTYQALGGHQTFHRTRNNSEKSKQETQRRISRS